MEQNNKNRVAKNILIAVLYVCAFLIAIFISFAFSANIWIRLLLVICGLLIGWIVSALFHELGHALAAKHNGFEVAAFSFLIFRYDKQAIKKFSVSFKNDFLGATDVIPVSKENIGKNYARTVAGGIIGSVVASALLTAGFMLSIAFAAPLAAMFFCGMPLSLVILVINAIPGLVDGNDGSEFEKMLTDNDEKTATIRLLTITEKLYDGKSYAEIDETLFDDDLKISPATKTRFALLKLRRAEEIFDPKKIVESLEELQAGEDYLDDEAAIEILFAYILIGDESKIAEYEYLLDKCDTLPGASGMRTLVYYANHKGDDKYVKATLKSAKKICAKAYLKGDGKFNAEMLSRL